MKEIFDRGDFHDFRIQERYFSAVEGRTTVLLEGRQTSIRTKVFLSHKHSDLDELKDIIGFLENKYNVDTYIDSMDKDMPTKTSGQTAIRIKDVIKRCDKFILLATDNAVESKWCNWELGFGDAHKYKDDIAILPIKEKRISEDIYKGREYMAIYPTIVYYDGTEKYTNGNYVKPGYYYCFMVDSRRIIMPLEDWLNS